MGIPWFFDGLGGRKGGKVGSLIVEKVGKLENWWNLTGLGDLRVERVENWWKFSGLGGLNGRKGGKIEKFEYLNCKISVKV